MCDNLICRCEEVPESVIKEAIAEGAVTIDGIKKRTRAGMGLCQGKTCRRIVARILAEETDRNPAVLLPPTQRPPVRPVKISIIAGEEK